jgi:hypothetical protein
MPYAFCKGDRREPEVAAERVMQVELKLLLQMLIFINYIMHKLHVI